MNENNEAAAAVNPAAADTADTAAPREREVDRFTGDAEEAAAWLDAMEAALIDDPAPSAGQATIDTPEDA